MGIDFELAMAGRQLSGQFSELVEQQPENGLAVAQGPTEA
jgi:hypothetical protein